jgi:hypothetical protein
MDVGALPFEITSLPRRRLFLGLATSLFGYVAAVACIFGGIALLSQDDAPSSPWPIVLIPYAASLVFAGILAQRLDALGRRLRQHDALSVLAADNRPPVLLLRSFADDDIRDLTSRTGRVGLHRTEENLCRALRRLGPVVAIGRPGERLPEVGAARLYVSDRTWQDAVRYFMDRAGAVVVVVGRSSGVMWETRTTLERVRLDRVLFFFPFAAPAGSREGLGSSLRMLRLGAAEHQTMCRDRDERYTLFREEIGRSLETPLPAALGDSQFVDFVAGRTPRLIHTFRPSGLDSLMQLSLSNARIGIHFERTLAPFFDKAARTALPEVSRLRRPSPRVKTAALPKTSTEHEEREEEA